jgi:DNA repair exonuclease SbcCD ATPase subunit
MLHFPSSLRLDLTIDERLMELKSWAQKLIDKRWHEAFVYEILDKCIQSGARFFVAYQHAMKAYQNVEREYQNVVNENQKAAQAHQNIEQEYKNVVCAYQNVERVLQDKQSELKMAHGQLQNIYRTFTWRFLNRLLKFPIIGSLIKWIGKVLAGESIR